MLGRTLKLLILSAAAMFIAGGTAFAWYMTYLGAWNSASNYQVGSVVTYENGIYYSLKNGKNALNRNHVPSSNPSWWAPLGTIGAPSTPAAVSVPFMSYRLEAQSLEEPTFVSPPQVTPVSVAIGSSGRALVQLSVKGLVPSDFTCYFGFATSGGGATIRSADLEQSIWLQGDQQFGQKTSSMAFTVDDLNPVATTFTFQLGISPGMSGSACILQGVSMIVTPL